mmetsp:Transcript_24100/g.40947  ORF Transcript_24100/g.40947 Transcript_24100/m.40947 type:complete len:552 (+) Transcript_24100:90-1745(+)
MLRSAALFLLSSNTVLGSNTVELPDGTRLEGDAVTAEVTAFKGVPFAAAPIGELRFAPPKAWSNPDFNTVIDATEYGSPCKQHYFDGKEIGDEDCLFLNVWTPANTTTRGSTTGDLPVAVYIHGGSYMSGMGNDIEGTDFVEYWQGRAIVVSMNYRLNVFGFSGSDALRAQDSEDGSTGNYGIQDQRLALQWVQKNIAAFGGDKDNVMVYGESAGAGSVTNHLVMKKSFGYFNSAILESGSFIQWVTQPLSMAQTAYDTLLSEVGCSDVKCLLSQPTEVIYDASLDIGSSDIAYGTPYNPTVDGVELFTHPWISASEGDVVDVPILHGTNLDEGSMFVPLPYDTGEAGLVAYWSLSLSKKDIKDLLEIYVTGQTYPTVVIDDVEVSKYWWAADRSMADYSFYCGAKYSSVEFSRQHEQGKRASPTFLYNFDYLADGSDVPFVQHTSEIPFMTHDNSYMASKADDTMADLLAGYWGAFMTHHNPNVQNNPSKGGESLPQWDAYVSTSDNLLKIYGPGNVTNMENVNKVECDFFIPLAEASIREMFPSHFHYP